MGPISIDENELQNRIDRAVKAGLGAVGSGIYKDHPLAAAFPMMEGEDYASLVEDIRQHGLREPIILYEGNVLDGRNRYRACIDAGVEPRFETYQGDDPVDYIISLNLRRRHLDAGQRAMVAARLATLRVGDNQYKKKGAGIQAPSQAEAAVMLNVSRDSIQKARVVVERGSLDLQRAVDAGRVSVSAAAEIALTDKDSQVRVLALTDDEIVEEAARIKRERQIEKVAQQCSESRADLFVEFDVELPVDAKIHFDRIIETAIAVLGELDKIIADAIWSLKLSDRKKVKAGLKKYSNEIERLPGRIKKLLAAGASADKTKAG